MAAVAVLMWSVPAAAAAPNDDAVDRMVDAVNKARADHGLRPMRAAPALTGSSQRFSHWLMSHDTFAHAATIDAGPGFSMLGEALAMHTGRRWDVGMTVRQWLGSPSHRALVLTHSMRLVGAGVTRGRFGGGPATIWVLRVGRR
ncbi:MAG TPA: CAP domain-containing protein [Thermoleophilaceae bacterium]|jgi:uncharacterized protein YkwD